MRDIRVRCAAAFMTQSVSLNDVIVKFEIWDTAGLAALNGAPLMCGSSTIVSVCDLLLMWMFALDDLFWRGRRLDVGNTSVMRAFS